MPSMKELLKVCKPISICHLCANSRVCLARNGPCASIILLAFPLNLGECLALESRHHHQIRTEPRNVDKQEKEKMKCHKGPMCYVVCTTFAVFFFVLLCLFPSYCYITSLTLVCIRGPHQEGKMGSCARIW